MLQTIPLLLQTVPLLSPTVPLRLQTEPLQLQTVPLLLQNKSQSNGGVVGIDKVKLTVNASTQIFDMLIPKFRLIFPSLDTQLSMGSTSSL